jgi:chromosome segregation ATPase
MTDHLKNLREFAAGVRDAHIVKLWSAQSAAELVAEIEAYALQSVREALGDKAAPGLDGVVRGHSADVERIEGMISQLAANFRSDRDRIGKLEELTKHMPVVGLEESIRTLNNNQAAAEGRIRALEERPERLGSSEKHIDQRVEALGLRVATLELNLSNIEDKFEPDNIVDTLRREVEAMDRQLFGPSPNLVDRVELLERRQLRLDVKAQWEDKPRIDDADGLG